MSTEPKLPHRVVDRGYTAWMARQPYGDAEQALGVPWVYESNDHKREVRTLDWLHANRAPLRYLRPPTDDEERRLRDALTSAGPAAVTTLCRALYEVCAAHPQVDITAGRPGSWEASALRKLPWTIGADLKPDRVASAALQEIRAVLTEWVAGEDGFVEVAETLAGELGPVIDAQGGWAAVADQGLRRADEEQYGETVMYYLASRSEWFRDRQEREVEQLRQARRPSPHPRGEEQ